MGNCLSHLFIRIALRVRIRSISSLSIDRSQFITQLSFPNLSQTSLFQMMFDFEVVLPCWIRTDHLLGFAAAHSFGKWNFKTFGQSIDSNSTQCIRLPENRSSVSHRCFRSCRVELSARNLFASSLVKFDD